jgi:predicted MPP superfamily phosphohydrolase
VSRRVLIAAFMTVLLIVVVGGHIYLADQLVLAPALPQPWRGFGLALIGLGAALLIAQPITERMLPPARARWVNWPASVWMGFAFLLLIVSFAAELAQLMVGAAWADVSEANPIAARMWAAGIIVCAFVGAAAGAVTAMREPRIERRELRLPRWPAALDGFRIVQISDVHIGPILDRRFAAAVVERCNALAPDLIVITGDLVDGHVALVGAEVAPFAGLRAVHGAYFVTGNHDHYSGADAWVARVGELGIRPLRNERVTIARDGAAFDLAGVEDHHTHLVSRTQREDLPRALAGRDVARPVILLAHDPLTFRAAARQGVDLQLSGHTHGGQIWPFRYMVRLSTPYVVGHYRQNG